MVQSKNAKKIDVVILCGGKGVRLRFLTKNLPKSMVEFGGRPYLSILMEYLVSFGFKRFILCIGYKGEVIKKYYKERKFCGKILFSEEKMALGTGGAIKNARRLVQSSPFLAMNADSICRLNFNSFIDFHFKKIALLSMALVKIKKNLNSGKVSLDRAGRIIRFEEKTKGNGNNFDSAGIYLMNKEIFSFTNGRKKFSLEYDLFPKILDKRCFGFKQKADLIDFGTPREYKRAKQLFSKGLL